MTTEPGSPDREASHVTVVKREITHEGDGKSETKERISYCLGGVPGKGQGGGVIRGDYG